MPAQPAHARIVVVGAGWWSANHHVPSLASYDGAELIAVCDRDRDRAQHLAQEYGVAEVLTEIGELVQVMGEFSSSTAGLFAKAEGGAGDDAGPGAEGNDPADQHPGTYAADHGGGQAYTQLTHLLGMLCWVTGRQVTQVAAFAHSRGLQVDVDDAAALRLSGGGTAVVTSTGMGGQAGGERHHVRYLGTRGTVDQDMLGDQATLRRGDGTEVALAGGSAPVERTWLPARAFADRLRGEGPDQAPGREGAAAAAAVEAVLQSAQTSTIIEAPQLP